ncbi:MAG: hypothetical protein IKS15_01770 [Opitutales bacterium]|nr:hypothetical protein [Opitutales bacterium]
MAQKYKYHFIPNTHLDREWTLDFEHTRKMTVDFIDDLLVIMKKIPGYTFLLDSQAVPLEDYLEIRPEKRAELKKHISAGRINAGPWYSALDMNTITGESVVRNMLYGHLTVEEFGKPMKVGYTPFGWGQVSQLPQIYKGFGVDVAMFYRGITREQAPRSEFIWRGADGSELLVSRFGMGARYNFYFGVWRKALYKTQTHRQHRRFFWHEDSSPFKLCDDSNRYNHGYVFPNNWKMDKSAAEEAFKKLVEEEKTHFGTPHIALMHGMDTSTPDLREAEILEQCKDIAKKDGDVFYSSLPRYAEDLKKAVKGQKLPVIEGEVRHLSMNKYGFNYIANDIISARSRQKVLLGATENALIKKAEPFGLMAWLNGAPWLEPFYNLAWRQYLKCHAHDTIGGCGIDRIEQDATYRLRDSISLSDMIASESLYALQAKIDTSKLDKNAIVITVFNPLPFARSATVSAFVDVAREIEGKGFEMSDYAGKAVKFDIFPTNYYGKVFRDHADLALMSYADEFALNFFAENVPALGYKTYLLKRTASAKKPAQKKDFKLENEFLKATVNADGTITVQDKTSNETYSNLNYFEDGGEMGHSWSHVSPIKDLIVSSKGAKAKLSRAVSGEVSNTIRAEFVLKIPADTPRSSDYMDWRQSTRVAKNLIATTFAVEYTLKAGAKNIEVKVEFENKCRNHRLRAMFNTGVKTENNFAESVFDIAVRRHIRDKKNPYADFPELTFPMARFSGLRDAKRGFAVLGGGLHEYETFADGKYALTITRAYENKICTSGDFDLEYKPGDLSQCIGAHTYKYALCFGEFGASFESLYKQADEFSAPLLAAETKARKGGKLPLEASFMSVEGGAVQLSCAKKAARSNAVAVRLFNPSAKPQKCVVKFARAAKSAWLANLNEEKQKAAKLSSGGVSVELAPKKIQTILVELK